MCYALLGRVELQSEAWARLSDAQAGADATLAAGSTAWAALSLPDSCATVIAAVVNDVDTKPDLIQLGFNIIASQLSNTPFRLEFCRAGGVKELFAAVKAAGLPSSLRFPEASSSVRTMRNSALRLHRGLLGLPGAGPFFMKAAGAASIAELRKPHPCSCTRSCRWWCSRCRSIESELARTCL